MAGFHLCLQWRYSKNYNFNISVRNGGILIPGMRRLLIFLIVTLPCSKSYSQAPANRHIITCISIVDEKGKPLIIEPKNQARSESMGENHIEIEAFPNLNNYGFSNWRINDFTETIVKDEETGQPRFYYYSGGSSTQHYPFQKKYYYFSGPIFEFTLARENGDEEYDVMRIIFINNKAKTDSSRITTFIMDDIVFKKGTYEIDCNKIKATRDAVYEDGINLRLFKVKNKPKARTKIRIPLSGFYYYPIDYIKFFPDSGIFRYSGPGSTFPYNSTIGFGFYKLTPHSLTLLYKNVPGRYKMHSISRQDSVVTDANIVKCIIVDETANTVPGASIVVKGTTIGVAADINGQATLKLKAARFPAVLIVTAMGYTSTEILIEKPGGYDVRCVLENQILYIDSGWVQKAIFTDFTDDYIGIYWLYPNTSSKEKFSFINQDQMSRRRFYYHRRIKRYSRAVVD